MRRRLDVSFGSKHEESSLSFYDLTRTFYICSWCSCLYYHRIPYFRSWIKERKEKSLWYFMENKNLQR